MVDKASWARDVRDWSHFVIVIIGVLVAAAGAAFALHDEIAKAPKIVQISLYVAASIAMLAICSTAVLAWHSRREMAKVRAVYQADSDAVKAEFQRSSERQKAEFEKLKAELGLVEIRDRKQTPPIYDVYDQIDNAYRWHGLSCVNEVVVTEIPPVIRRKSQAGTKFEFTLADERDWLRIKEQKVWENEETRPIERLIENISSSKQVIRSLSTKESQVGLINAARIPCFRIVEIDNTRIEVAHYDKGGCGYSGIHLVLRKPADRLGNGLLYEWFQRAASVDRKNAVIDDIYNRITGMMFQRLSSQEIVDKVLHDAAFDTLRQAFREQFSWWLDEEDIQKTIEFLKLRYAVPLEQIDARSPERQRKR